MSSDEENQNSVIPQPPPVPIKEMRYALRLNKAQEDACRFKKLADFNNMLTSDEAFDPKKNALALPNLPLPPEGLKWSKPVPSMIKATCPSDEILALSSKNKNASPPPNASQFSVSLLGSRFHYDSTASDVVTSSVVSMGKHVIGLNQECPLNEAIKDNTQPIAPSTCTIDRQRNLETVRSNLREMMSLANVTYKPTPELSISCRIPFAKGLDKKCTIAYKKSFNGL
jgi:hypothetical protein